MGGTIELKSKVNEGTTLTVTLSFDVGETGEKPEPQADHAAMQRCAEGMRVLVAEDNDLNREIVRFVLEQEGSTPVEAHNDQEALETLRESKPGEFVLCSWTS